MLTYSQRKGLARNGAALAEKWVQEGLDARATQEAAEQAVRLAAYQAKHAPVEFTEAEYRAARVVRDGLGWHKVVRVNAKSVTVETGYYWTARIQRAKILEVK